MRRLATAALIREFFHQLGRRSRRPSTVYLTGGATAVLMGWRESTIDIDVRFDPDTDELLRLLPTLKEELAINVELASPDLFVPVPTGWEDRSPWETTEGKIVVRHFDLYAQALAKIERDHQRDRLDVAEMVKRGLVEPRALRDYFSRVEGDLYRYPAVDPKSLRQRVERVAEVDGR